MDIVRRDEQYEEARSELNRKGARIQELESELEQKGRDMAAKETEIQRLCVSEWVGEDAFQRC